jgi:hypothetical protein
MTRLGRDRLSSPPIGADHPDRQTVPTISVDFVTGGSGQPAGEVDPDPV